MQEIVFEAPNVEVQETPPETPVEVTEQAAEQPQAEQPQEQEAQEQESERDDKGRFKKNGVQQRIDEVTRLRYEAEREAAYWRERAKTLEQKPEAVEKKPDAGDFDNHNDFVEALTEWKAKEIIKANNAERDKESAARAEQTAKQATAQTWNERVTKFSETTKDFAEVLSSAVNVPMNETMTDVLMSSEVGPELAYHLAKNPEEAERIASLSPTQAAVALGKLEASLAKQAETAAPTIKKVTQAPAPLKPMNTAAASANKSLDQMSQSEYEAYRKQQGAWWANR